MIEQAIPQVPPEEFQAQGCVSRKVLDTKEIIRKKWGGPNPMSLPDFGPGLPGPPESQEVLLREASKS